MLKNIPHKTAQNKASNPWISLELHRLIRNQDQRYRQMMQHGTYGLEAEVKELQRELQRKLPVLLELHAQALH